MKKLILVLLLIAGCSGLDCRDAGQRALDRCQAECRTYGATFARTTRSSSTYGEESWECWCRRLDPVLSEQPDCIVLDTDHGEICSCKGQPSEASLSGESLRIW